MDSLSQSLSSGKDDPGFGYQSCIHVDGRRILPPVMSETKRVEMRRFRDIAARREAQRRRRAEPSAHIPVPLPAYRGPPPPAAAKEDNVIPVPIVTMQPVSDNESDADGDNFISVPVDTMQPVDEGDADEDNDVPVPIDTMQPVPADEHNVIPVRIETMQPVPADEHNFIPVLKETIQHVPADEGDSGEHNFIPVPIETVPPVPVDEGDPDEDNYSQTSFESATSDISTATFIIDPSQSYAALHNSGLLSEGEVFDFDEDDDLDEAANLGAPKINEPVNQEVSDHGDDTGNIFRETTSEVFKDDNMSTVSTNTNTARSSAFDSMGLSKLKSKMQTMPASLFKVGPDSYSPLMKGVVFMDPLNRPRAIKKIPLAALDPSMKPKFDRVSACVKGYLVRRLLKTEKVTILLQTIHESVELILNLYADGSREKGARGPSVLTNDLELHGRLVQQLNFACSGIQDIFCALSTKERMAIISTDRTKLRAKAVREAAAKLPSAKKNISIATQRSMERRKTIVLPPGPKRAKYHADKVKLKLPLHVPSHVVPNPVPAVTSQNVKPKGRKSVIVSPKRRRMTTYSKPSTPQTHRSAHVAGHLSRLSHLDKIKSSSNPNVSGRKIPVSTVSVGRMKSDIQNRKKMDSTFVKPKPKATHPLVSSNY